MKEQYDFLKMKARKNPYAAKLKGKKAISNPSNSSLRAEGEAIQKPRGKT